MRSQSCNWTGFAVVLVAAIMHISVVRLGWLALVWPTRLVGWSGAHGIVYGFAPGYAPCRLLLGYIVPALLVVWAICTQLVSARDSRECK